MSRSYAPSIATTAQIDPTLPNMTVPDDGTWALTPQDHATLQVQAALKTQRRGYRQAMRFLLGSAVLVPVMGVLGLVDDMDLLDAALFGLNMGAMAWFTRAVTRKGESVLHACVTDNGVDVGRWRAWLKRQARSATVSARGFFIIAGACAVMAAILGEPAFLLVTALGAFSGVCIRHDLGGRTRRQLQELDAPGRTTLDARSNAG